MVLVSAEHDINGRVGALAIHLDSEAVWMLVALPHGGGHQDVGFGHNDCMDVLMPINMSGIKRAKYSTKKDPGVDHRALTNREKALIVDALRGSFPIAVLLERLGLARSSFYYKLSAMSVGDRYGALLGCIGEAFHRFRATRGHRFIRAALR